MVFVSPNTAFQTPAAAQCDGENSDGVGIDLSAVSPSALSHGQPPSPSQGREAKRLIADVV